MTCRVSKNTNINVKPDALYFGNELGQQAKLRLDSQGRLHLQLNHDEKAIAVRFTTEEVALIRKLIK